MPQFIQADADADRRKRIMERRRKALLLGLILISPWQRYKSTMNVAGNTVEDWMTDASDMLDEGTAVKTAARASSIVAPMKRLISRMQMNGYLDGLKNTGGTLPDGYAKTVAEAAEKRASFVDKSMKRTTQKWLNEGRAQDVVLSGARAQQAVEYEAGRAYYQGLLGAFGKNSGFQKMWVTSADDLVCEDCLDNEDEGYIGMDEAFDSGDWAPPMHLSCRCELGINRQGEGNG